jgi:hypothetical protein
MNEKKPGVTALGAIFSALLVAAFSAATAGTRC